MNSIKDVQHWLQTTLISRGDLDEKLSLAKDKTGLTLDELIHSKRGVSAYERIDIYASGYVLRLLECMQADYPKLRSLIGDELFDTFAKAYIITIPSSSWSLHYLGKKFPEFLEETNPKKGEPFFDTPAQIAYLERAEVEIIQEKGFEGKNKKKLAFFDIFKDDLKLKKANTLKLLKQNYHLVELYSNVQPIKDIELPEKKETYIAISRKNYLVEIRELEYWQYIFLYHIKENISLTELIKNVEKNTEFTATQIRSKLLFWLPLAVELDLLEVL